MTDNPGGKRVQHRQTFPPGPAAPGQGQPRVHQPGSSHTASFGSGSEQEEPVELPLPGYVPQTTHYFGAPYFSPPLPRHPTFANPHASVQDGHRLSLPPSHSGDGMSAGNPRVSQYPRTKSPGYSPAGSSAAPGAHHGRPQSGLVQPSDNLPPMRKFKHLKTRDGR